MSSTGRVNDIEITDNSDFGIQSGLNITGNLSITATGSDIVQYGEAIVGGNLSVTGRDITLDDTDNDFGTVRLSGRDVVLADSDGIELGTSMVRNLNITAGGAVTDSGALTVTGTANISANSGMSAITLDEGSNDFGTVELSGSNVTVVDSDAMELGISTVRNLNITAGGRGDGFGCADGDGYGEH